METRADSCCFSILMDGPRSDADIAGVILGKRQIMRNWVTKRERARKKMLYTQWFAKRAAIILRHLLFVKCDHYKDTEKDESWRCCIHTVHNFVWCKIIFLALRSTSGCQASFLPPGHTVTSSRGPSRRRAAWSCLIPKEPPKGSNHWG